MPGPEGNPNGSVKRPPRLTGPGFFLGGLNCLFSATLLLDFRSSPPDISPRCHYDRGPLAKRLFDAINRKRFLIGDRLEHTRGHLAALERGVECTCGGVTGRRICLDQAAARGGS